jgi:hypothetical protein
MESPARGPATYPIVIPIDTNRGTGRTLRVGPAHISFVTAAHFAPGESLRFSMSLRGIGPMTLQVFCSGRVHAVRVDGDFFVVEASIEQTDITSAKQAAFDSREEKR